jgi:hypothetical protein
VGQSFGIAPNPTHKQPQAHRLADVAQLSRCSSPSSRVRVAREKKRRWSGMICRQRAPSRRNQIVRYRSQ